MPTWRVALGPKTSPSGLQAKGSQSRRGAKDFTLLSLDIFMRFLSLSSALYGTYGRRPLQVYCGLDPLHQTDKRLFLAEDWGALTHHLQRANILKEVQIMRQLDHPNIIKLIDFSESKQYYYIILELSPGGELFHQIVRLTYFSEDLSRHVIVQVAKALAYLHEERGVVHRCVLTKILLISFIITFCHFHTCFTPSSARCQSRSRR